MLKNTTHSLVQELESLLYDYVPGALTTKACTFILHLVYNELVLRCRLLKTKMIALYNKLIFMYIAYHFPWKYKSTLST